MSNENSENGFKGKISVSRAKEIETLKAPLSEETQQKILDLAMSSEMTIKKIKQTLGITDREFYQTIKRNPLFAASFQQSRALIIEEMADNLITITDDEPDVLKARLKSDNIKWLLSKRKPSTYGDKIDINITQTIDVAGALAEARARASLPIIKPNNVIDAELIGDTNDKQSVNDIFS